MNRPAELDRCLSSFVRSKVPSCEVLASDDSREEGPAGGVDAPAAPKFIGFNACLLLNAIGHTLMRSEVRESFRSLGSSVRSWGVSLTTVRQRTREMDDASSA